MTSLANKFLEALEEKGRSGYLTTVSAIALGVFATAPFATSAAFAADAASSNALPEITVTAQFRSQNLQNTPLSITAVNSTMLEARSETSISQVALQAPNVTLIPGNAVFGPALGAQIRGVGQFDFNPAYEPGVGMYVDDVYYATLTGSEFDLLDLDRVEILRGPQGTLTGRNSEGGAIRLISKKPTGDGTGFFEGTYGSRHRVGIRTAADVTLAKDLFARVSGVYKEQAGYVNQIDYGCANPGNSLGVAAQIHTPGCRVSRFGSVGYAGVKGMLRYNPGEKLDVLVEGDYTHSDNTNPADVPTLSALYPQFICGKFCTYASYVNPTGTDTVLGLPAGTPAAAVTATNRQIFRGWGISGHIDYKFNDLLALKSITAFRKYVSSFGDDTDYTPLHLAAGNNKLDHHFFSQEVRLNGNVGSLIDYTVGGFYSTQKTTYYTQQDIRYIIPGLALQFIGNDPVNADSKAAFGTVFLHATDALTFTGGIRYTKEHKDYTFIRHNYDGTINSFLDGVGAAYGSGYSGPDTLDYNHNGNTTEIVTALDGTTSVYNGDRVDYRLSVDYRFSPAVLVYATWSTGFKGGGVTARPFNAAQALNGSFGPETLTAYEIGAKTNLLDDRIRLNVAGFYNKYKDVQLPLSDCSGVVPGDLGPCGVVQNAGNAHFTGFEAELTAQPIEGLGIDGSMSYIHAVWDNILPAVGASTSLSDPASNAPRGSSVAVFSTRLNSAKIAAL